jgi:hypothetical protein
VQLLKKLQVWVNHDGVLQHVECWCQLQSSANSNRNIKCGKSINERGILLTQMPTSVVPARLGLKATALAFEIFRLGQSHQ